MPNEAVGSNRPWPCDGLASLDWKTNRLGIGWMPPAPALAADSAGARFKNLTTGGAGQLGAQLHVGRAGVSYPAGGDCRVVQAGGSTAAQGKQVYAKNCAACPGDGGQGGIKIAWSAGKARLRPTCRLRRSAAFGPTRPPCWTRSTAPCRTRCLIVQYRRQLRRCRLHPEPEQHSSAGRQARSRQPAEIKLPNRDGSIPDPEFAPASPRASR